ncbi:DUF342 domain-containing protein [Thermosipho ferrireducens]|uniref:DUF342 domain-containing protein n=1 Tax=Thermosipho ferrireducens TaxID=2571116 RepID=A0ABX7S5I6_9BACT|nr:FapA family protein [Thermosipho ferrireducens]QTA37812.1 DUF342 domain-containing protein [Thermosipho ferrireducens]
MIIDVQISQDRMSASVMLRKTRDDDKVTPKEIYEALSEKGVVYGIDKNAIVRLCEFPEYEVPIKVAEGTPPHDGKDGRVEFEDFHSENVVTDKKVNFREFLTHKRIIVKPGQRIATIIPPTPGEAGKNVLGEDVPPTPGKEAEIKLGSNVVLSDDGKIITSKIEGMLRVDKEENFIDVDETLEVEGNVDYSTGNIDFPGTVVIKGDVRPGFVVRAKSNINIEGVVEAATVISLEGNVTIFGVKAREKGLIKASGDVFVNYAEGANIEARNLYFTDQLSNCHVKVTGSIISKDGKGVVVGGEYIAGLTIEVDEIGSEIAVSTHVEVGIPPYIIEEMRLLKTQIALDKSNVEKLLKVVKQYKKLKEAKVDIPEDKMKLFSKSASTLIAVREQLEKNIKRLHEIEEIITNTKSNAKIVARKIIHPGVEVVVQNLKHYINVALKKAVLKLENNKIVVGGYKE